MEMGAMSRRDGADVPWGWGWEQMSHEKCIWDMCPKADRAGSWELGSGIPQRWEWELCPMADGAGNLVP